MADRDVREGGSKALRRVAFGIATVPVAILTVFLVAEGVGREPGWWSHLLQLVPVLMGLALARSRPRAGGALLLVVALALLVLALLAGRTDALVGAVLVVTVPLVASGTMLVLLGRHPA